MKKHFVYKILVLLAVLGIFSLGNQSFAQSLMQSTVSIKADHQPLHDILTIISNDANVTFSYNTKVINRDSLITVQAVNKPLADVLRTIFGAGYEFKESGSYIIIRKKPVSTSAVVSKVPIHKIIITLVVRL